MTKILDGKKLAQKLREKMKEFVKHERICPHLVVFLAHPNPASEIYVANKMKACAEVGIRTTLITTPFSQESALLDQVLVSAQDPDVDGILIQVPLHPDINQKIIMQAIPPEKDVDGFHPVNLGKLVQGDPSGFVPCTPLGILTLLKSYDVATHGKHVVIVGRSITVGKPLAMLLSQKGIDATVTLAHSATKDLENLCLSADIIVAAAGHQNLITSSMVKKGAVVIDVGINRIEGKICGDVDPLALTHCGAYSPVPGGVGPMTIASLLENTIKSYLNRHKHPL